MRVVLDTNVLLSAFINRDGYPFRALGLWPAKRYHLVTSLAQIEELRRASRYPAVRSRVTRAEMGRLVNVMRQRAFVVEELPSVDASPDPDDDLILATAIAGGAHYLVTGDKADLLALGTVQGVRLLGVREFVGLFAPYDR